MTFRLAHDEITLEHGGNAVTLRPSLRAVARLEAKFSFETLFRNVYEFNLTTIREIILTASQSRQDAAAFLSSLSEKPLSLIYAVVAAPVTDLCNAFIPADEPDSKPATGKPIPWPEVYRELYRTATGWIGWQHADAWAATPTEINEAYVGHIAKLKAIHGSDEDHKNTEDKPAKQTDPDFDRNALEALRGSIMGAGR